MTNYAALEARIAALEQRASLPPSYAPASGMVVAADGSITYDFDGHINATGLDLTVDPAQPVDSRSIRWLNLNGAMLASIVGNQSGGAGTQKFLFLKAGNTQLAIVDDPANQANSGVSILAGPAGNLKFANVFDGNGNSDFL